MPLIDIIIEEDRWTQAGLPDLAKRSFEAAFQTLELADEFEISLLACDDARIAALNDDFRGNPRATNVLSWPSEDRGANAPGTQPDPPAACEPELGDIALAYETCQKEAVDQNKPFENHICHLLVHGLLHLLGYDHENDPDAALMEGLERQILAKLGIPDPY